MLEACNGYLDDSGLSDLKENFVIIDEITGKEIAPAEDT